MTDPQQVPEPAALLAAVSSPWKSVAAEGRAWMDRGLARDAVIHRRPVPRGPVRVTQSERLGERDQPFSFWCDGPRRIRSEYTIGAEEITVVVDGTRWWRTSPVLGSTSGSLAMRPAGLLLGPPGVLVQGPDLLEQLDLDSSRSGTVAGRPVQVVGGAPSNRRTPGRFFLREAGIGAERYEVSIDTTSGFVLSVVAVRAGRPFRIIEVTSVRFDEPSPTNLFESPRGSTEITGRAPARERLDLSSVAAAQPFTVLVPDPPPSDVPPHLAVFDADRRGPGPQRLVVTYAVFEPDYGRGQLRISMSATALGRSMRDEWQQVEDFEVSELAYGKVLRHRIRARRFGTYVELDSTVLPTSRLRELLSSLVPVELPSGA